MLRYSVDALIVRLAAPHADCEAEGADVNPGFARGSIAAQRDTATGTLPLVFATNGQIAEAVPSGVIAAPASETILLAEITCEGRTFLFNHPLPVRVVQGDGGWTCESPKDYHLLSYGQSRSEAESSFRHIFAYCWDDVACEDDERLAQGARNQKRALLALVKTQQ
jgi:hypothetical protein